MTDASAHYTVLARRFRPQTFDEVVGQERIGQALRNAIRSDRVAHAYLFTGARGVGKTSTARIFAKALNCPNAKDAVPCNECDVCKSIAAGGDIDVLEIDGASNRGIDDIRTLRSNVHVKSMRSPYKVYIIDEVHMLTKEAFNALLKTLEEPPAHVKFVFCTTEPSKVPDTILSRCQRFDFGTIATASIKERLESISVAEGVSVDSDALDLVARRAAGSMRDSQSLFDQLLAFGGERITADDVHQLLGTASDERLIALVDALIGRRRDQALGILDQSLHEGVQIGSLSDQLLNYLRDLLIIAAGAEDVDLQSVGGAQRRRLSDQASVWGLQTITAAMQILADTKARMQRVNYDRALLELAVIRLSLLEELDEIGALIAALQSGGSDSAGRGRPPVVQPGQPSASKGNVGTTSSNSSGDVQSSSSRVVEPVSHAPVVQEVSEQRVVELAESALVDFMSEVYIILGDRISGHLRKAASIAISGPNRLEISFPQSYFLSKQYVERPEILQQIQEAASRIGGQSIHVSVIAMPVKPDQGELQSAPIRRQNTRRKVQELNQDTFVEQAASIFGGTLVDVREIYDATGEE